MHEIDLVIDGLSYRGWESIMVRRSLEEFERSFSVTYNDRWTERSEIVPIRKGQAFQVTVDGDVLITGYIDDTAIRYDAQQHTLTAVGRSSVGDLCDCVAVVASGKKRRWPKGSTIQKIATELCSPFSITVGGPTVTDVLRAPLAHPFSVERGERVFEALSRLADLKGLLLQSTVGGDVVFTRAGTKKVSTVLRYGDNIKTCSYNASDRERFSHYVFRGQSVADDNHNGTASTQIKGFAEDAEIKRYRPFEVTARVQSDKRDLGFRAIWERNTRAGRSETVSYGIRGWTHADGLWAPNTLVDVDDRATNLRDTMLISSVTLNASAADGYTAELELVDRRTYDVVGTPKPKRKVQPRPKTLDQPSVPAFILWEPGK